MSTKEESLAHAKDFAEDWYLELKGKQRAGQLRGGKTFREAAEHFETEFEFITQGQRSPRCIEDHKLLIHTHLLPFFGDLLLAEITPGKVQEYRLHRHKNPRLSAKAKEGAEAKAPSRSTLHHEIVALRHLCKLLCPFDSVIAVFYNDFNPSSF